MTVLYAALLGLIQGLTEFLPISSSAHLILARALLGWNAEQFGLSFDVACHLGTLLALLVYFRRDLVSMAGAAPSLFTNRDHWPARLLALIAVGTIPIVIVGATLSDLIEGSLRTPIVAAVALAIGAVGLLVVERAGTRVRSEATLGLGEALMIGIAQATALVPGVSRSGATIMVALWCGLNRAAGARFSFLLGIPAVAAAAAKTAIDLRHEPLPADVQIVFLVGIVTSAIVGYFTVKYFLRYLEGHSLDVFAYYRLALSAVVPIWLVMG